MGRGRGLAVIGAPVMGGGGLVATVRAWQNDTTLVHLGGYEAASWATFSSFAAGYTVIMPRYAMRQAGYIAQVKVQWNSVVNPAGVCKFKVFRWNAGSSEYDIVADYAFTPASTGGYTETVTINPPIEVQAGDIPGIFSGTNCQFRTDTSTVAQLMRYVNADVTAANAFTSTLNRMFQFEVLGYRPYLAITGDSILEGHNTLTPYHGTLHDIDTVRNLPGGTATSEVGAQIRAHIGNGSVLRYQNLALGSQTFSNLASTLIAKCVAVSPHSILILCGVNDISTGRTWEQVVADLATIRAATTARLLICEILPWTDGTDEQSGTLRTFNTNLAAWAASNAPARLIICHDAMGQTRAGTGELDDLLTAYDYDGVHLTAAGVDALAARIAAQM